MDINLNLHEESLNSNNNKRDIYNQWAETYEAYVKNINYVGPKNVALNFSDFISNSNNNNFKILDFGCGTGLLGLELNQNLIGRYSFTIDGIDISENMIQKCREKKIYREIIDINLETDYLPEDRIYDYIVSSGVFLEGHVSFKVINNILNNLKQFGFLFLTVRETFIDKNLNQYLEFISLNPRLEFIYDLNIEYLPDIKCKLIVLKKLY